MSAIKMFWAQKGLLTKERLLPTLERLIEGVPNGKHIYITFEQNNGKRSLRQNRYWWGVVIETMRRHYDDLGVMLTPDQVNEVVCHHIGHEEAFTDPHGIRHVIRKSTSNQSKEQFGELMEKVWAWAAVDLGVYIPPPEDKDLIPQHIIEDIPHAAGQ